MELVREEKKNDNYVKGYRISDRLNLKDFVTNVQEKGLSVSTIYIEETLELDMKSFGSEVLKPAQTEELQKYHNSKNYMIQIASNYHGDYVKIVIYDHMLQLSTKKDDIYLDTIYDDTKKNELDEMFGSNNLNNSEDSKGFSK